MRYGVNSTVYWMPPDIRHEVARPFSALNLLTYAASGHYESATNLSAHSDIKWQIGAGQQKGAMLMGHPCLYAVTGDKERFPAYGDMRDHLDWYLAAYPEMSVLDIVNEPFNQPLPEGWAESLYDAARGRVLRRCNECGWEQSSTIRGKMRSWVERGRADVLGLQMHVYQQAWNATANSQRITRIKRGMKELRACGVPLHITEVSVPSAGNGWTPARQKDHLLALYSAFREGGASVISYWDIADSLNPWNQYSGLLDASNKPKPAYEALRAWMEANP